MHSQRCTAGLWRQPWCLVRAPRGVYPASPETPRGSVFCTFLSNGKDFRDCGRPCEEHEVKLRDRTGAEHILMADAECRNTVFNATAQTGAEYAQHFIDLGVRHFRIEFVDESPKQVIQTLNYYQQLLAGEISGAQLWKTLRLQNQLGVTRGTLD